MDTDINLNKSLEKLSSNKRLMYLINKYFYTISSFAESADIRVQVIYDFINNKTLKISSSNLVKIENNVGFSKEYIKYGVGNELIEGCKLSPITKPKETDTLPKKIEKIIGKQLSRGEARKVKLAPDGRTTTKLTEPSITNIVDIAFDGIKNILVINIIDIQFCTKYNIQIGSVIVINDGIFNDGDYVLVSSKRKHYICEYIKGTKDTKDRLVDIVKEKEETGLGTFEIEREIDIDDAEIIGKVYCKVEKFQII